MNNCAWHSFCMNAIWWKKVTDLLSDFRYLTFGVVAGQELHDHVHNQGDLRFSHVMRKFWGSGCRPSLICGFVFMLWQNSCTVRFWTLLDTPIAIIPSTIRIQDVILLDPWLTPFEKFWGNYFCTILMLRENWHQIRKCNIFGEGNKYYKLGLEKSVANLWRNLSTYYCVVYMFDVWCYSFHMCCLWSQK